MLQFGIGEIERQIVAYESFPLERRGGTADDLLQNQVLNEERHRVLNSVGAYLHQYMGSVRMCAQEELDNLKLLGPDHKLVIQHMNALETGVGNELLAALRSLGSDNPADWSSAALLCRNVVLRLGPTLFPAEIETYRSVMAGRSLDLKGEREKNRLLAYIDWHWQLAPNEVAGKTLERCVELTSRLYDRGSMGKRTMRLADAQQLVVDAFELVALLISITDLSPILEYAEPNDATKVSNRSEMAKREATKRPRQKV